MIKQLIEEEYHIDIKYKSATPILNHKAAVLAGTKKLSITRNIIKKTSFRMNCRKIIIVPLFIALFFLPVFAKGQSAYVRKFTPVADSLSEAYGVPAALFLGVAVIESGAGKSRNAKMLNNHFGIVGKNSLHKKGKKSRYKQYASPTLSYVDFANHLTKRKFYKRLKGKMNQNLWVDAMSKDNYSEMPKVWKQRVLSAIKTNKLTSLQK